MLMAKRDLAKPEKAINALTTIVPEEINSIGNDGWEEFEFAVDSGASETVIGPEMISSAETKESAASKRGVVYEVANGVRIENLGEKKFIATSEEGISRHITAQVCEVNKGLLSVHRIVQAGNRVIFDPKGSYIEDAKTGDKMHIAEKNCMFMLKMWTTSSSRWNF